MSAFSGADASVRPARATDVEALVAVHDRSWRSYPSAMTSGVSREELRQGWTDAIVTPPGPGFVVLVATSADLVVGFAAAAPDGELVALHVDPTHQRQGHGSRLLAAVVDHLIQREVPTVGTWVPTVDDARLTFFRSAGLGSGGDDGGAFRELLTDDGEVGVRELWLVAHLDEQADPHDGAPGAHR